MSEAPTESGTVAELALAGAQRILLQAQVALQAALTRTGEAHPVGWPGTAYALPLFYALSGRRVETLAEIGPLLQRAATLIPERLTACPEPKQLGEIGIGAALAAEALQACRHLMGDWPTAESGIAYAGLVDDVVLRSWGIQLADGRIPGFAILLGAAPSGAHAVALARGLQARGMVVFTAGSGASSGDHGSVATQLADQGIALGYDTLLVPLGPDTVTAVHALDFATRVAMTFGAIKPGQQSELLDYTRRRVNAFVLHLGPLDEEACALAAAALAFGFPVVADVPLPAVLRHQERIDGLLSVPWPSLGDGAADQAERMVQACLEARGIKVRITEVPIPVPYGSAYEGERVRRENLRVEFGARASACFELLSMAEAAEVEDGKVSVIGPELDDVPMGGGLPLGIVVKVAGRKMQEDFEPVLERQIHHFINGAEGVQHIGQRDITWIRMSKGAADKGFRVEHLGAIIHARLHARFPEIVDRVEVALYTREEDVLRLREQARQVYRRRNERAAALTDEAVDVFYSCSLCQSFAPNHICIVNPERVGLCGGYNWFDCRASSEINPTGPNRAVAKGAVIDSLKGEFDSVNEFVRQASNGAVERITLYSLTDAPMTSCGCFECITMIVPEANGVMVVSREDPGLTPAGMSFSTLAGMVGGGAQNPGVMGHGKYFLTSRKYLLAEGGFKRVVWMSRLLKEQMADELAEVCRREGAESLLSQIADERDAVTLDDLLVFLPRVTHPALTMAPII